MFTVGRLVRIKEVVWCKVVRETLSFKGIHNGICNLRFFSMCTSLLQGWMSMTLHSPVCCSVTRWITRMGSTNCRINAFGCVVQGSFLTHMYSVVRHSCRSSSSRNRMGKPCAAHLARLDYLLIYLPTQVQMTDFKDKMHQIPPQTPLGELTALPQTP